MTVIAFTGRLNPDEVERFTKYVTVLGVALQ